MSITIGLSGSNPLPIHAGDLVAIGDSPRPRATVVAIFGDLAWIRDLDTAEFTLAAAETCRPVRIAAAGGEIGRAPRV